MTKEKGLWIGVIVLLVLIALPQYINLALDIGERMP